MQVRGAVYAFAAAAMFGLGVVLARILGTQVDAPVVAFLSLTGGGVLLTAYLRLKGAAPLAPLARLTRGEWIDLVLLAAIGTAVPLLLVVAGFARTGAIEGGFVLQINGVAALVFAVLLLGERMRWRQSGGIVLLLGGSALVILAAPRSPGQGSGGVGDLLVLAGAIAIGFGFVPAKRLATRVNTLLLTAWRLLLGAALLLPVVVAEVLIAGHSLVWHPATSTLLVVLPAYIVSNFCVAYLAQQEGLRLAKAWEMAAIMQTVPLFSTVLAVVLLRDRMSLAQIAGGVVAILGGLAVALSGDPQPAEEPEAMASGPHSAESE